MAAEFEWDAKKAEENLKKHAVAFGEALTVFADPLANIFDDPDHSVEERRELIIGQSAKQRPSNRELYGPWPSDSNHRRQKRDGA